MQFIVALLKKLPIAPILALVIGVIVGLLIGWQTKTFSDATPSYLRADLQVDYLRMAIDSYRINQDPNLAVRRWQDLGSGAQPAFTEIQKNPNGMDPAVVQAYGELVTSVLSANGGQPTQTAGSGSPLTRILLLVGAGLALMVFLAAD